MTNQRKDFHMTSLEARQQLNRVEAGGRVPQDVAAASLKEVERLRYEYAAQVWRPYLEKWLFVGPSGLWERPRRARWYMLPTTAERMAIERHPGERVRIVARAYSQPIVMSEEEREEECLTL
ncbi:hypothetical protein ACL1FX_00045 [Corynebacterium striatum]